MLPSLARGGLMVAPLSCLSAAQPGAGGIGAPLPDVGRGPSWGNPPGRT